MEDDQRRGRRCIYRDCRAWAMRGGLLCVAHQKMVSRENQAAADALGPMRDQGLLDDVALIDAELQRLLEARDEFAKWAKELKGRDDTDDAAGALKRLRIRPGDCLRAWERISARIAHFVKARRELLGPGQAAQPDGLVEAVLRDLLTAEEAADADA